MTIRAISRPTCASLSTLSRIWVVALSVLIWSASQTRAQSVWQVQLQPELHGVLAAVPGDAGNLVSFACTQPGAPSHLASGRPIRPHAPGQLILFFDPEALGRTRQDNSALSLTLSVDGRAVGQVPVTLAMPEALLGTIVTYDHAIITLLKAAGQMEVTNPANGRAIRVPLRGFTAVVDDVIRRCQSPASTAGVPALTQLGTQSAPQVNQGPSFDCSRARHPSEQAICASAALAQKDVALAAAYEQTYQAAPRNRQSTLRAQQRRWLAVRNNCQSAVPCLAQAMDTRLEQLTAFAAETANQQQQQTATLTPQKPVAGQTLQWQGELWYGSVTCRRTKDVEAEFNITGRNPQGQYVATLALASPKSLSSGTSKAAYLGETGSDGSIRFVVTRQIRGGVGQRRPSGFDLNPATGKARFSNGDCSVMELERLTPTSPRMVSTVPRPANGGTFYAAPTPRAKCEALIEWVGRLNSEYPDIDFYRTSNGPALARKMINLFGDADFVPVFGAPFETIPYQARVDIRTFSDRVCMKDPFVRERFETFRSAAHRTITGGGKNNELTSNGYTSTLFAVRKLRKVRNEIKILMQSATTGGVTVTSLEKARAELTQHTDLLWPSERQAVMRALDDSFARAASAQADQIVRKVLSQTDAAKAVHAADSAILEFRSTFRKVLPQRDIDAAIKRLTTHRAGAVKAIQEPAFDAIRAVPSDMAGLQMLQDQSGKVPQTFSVLNAKERETYSTLVDTELRKRLNRLIEARVADMPMGPLGLPGLEAQVEWSKTFKADFAAHAAQPQVKQALERLQSARAQLLEDSLGQFETDLASASSDADKDTVLAKYLSRLEDANLPIALEYELLRLTAE